jgi:hypothetical protein
MNVPIHEIIDVTILFFASWAGFKIGRYERKEAAKVAVLPVTPYRSPVPPPSEPSKRLLPLPPQRACPRCRRDGTRVDRDAKHNEGCPDDFHQHAECPSCKAFWLEEAEETYGPRGELAAVTPLTRKDRSG